MSGQVVVQTGFYWHVCAPEIKTVPDTRPHEERERGVCLQWLSNQHFFILIQKNINKKENDNACTYIYISSGSFYPLSGLIKLKWVLFFGSSSNQMLS